MEPEPIEEVVEEVVEEKVVPDPQVEERARMQGWTSKDEFKGDPERWISAEDYVERADTMMPILKSVNTKLEGKLTAIEKELKEHKELSKKMVKIHGKYSEAQYEEKIADIKTKKLEAVEEGDTEKYEKLEEEESKVEKPESLEMEEPPAQEDHPEIIRWQKENKSWYGADEELTEYADIIANRLAQKGHSYKEYDFCNAVKDKVMVMFPGKFKNPKAKEGSGLDESDTRGSDALKTGKKTWGDLPKDAKDQCAELVATIPGYTKEKYLKEYFEEA